MTDTLTLLEEALPKIAPALQARSLGTVLGRVSDKTADCQRQAQRSEALIALAASLEGLGEANVLSGARAVASAAAEIGEALGTAQDTADLEDILDDYGQFPAALGRLDLAIRQLWGDRCRRDYASLIPVGELLKRISGAATLGAGLAEVGGRAEALAARNQPAELMAGDISGLKLEREKLLAELSAFTSDPAVDRFITAVTGGRASLDLVTPVVFAWLEDHQALTAFRVTG